MKTENYSYQPLSPCSYPYNNDSITHGYASSFSYTHDLSTIAVVSPSLTCSSSSSIPSDSPFIFFPSTPEPEIDDQKTRNNTIHHLVSKPRPKKQYQCPECLKSFTRPSALQTHSYTHTAEKPFQCQSPNCGRSFSVVSNLRRHFKVHKKAAVGDKLSAEDRLRCVRNLMERSDKILATKKQLPYSNPVPIRQQQARRSLPPITQHSSHYPYHPILPDLMTHYVVSLPSATSRYGQEVELPSTHFAPSSFEQKIPIYWVQEFGTTTSINVSDTYESGVRF